MDPNFTKLPILFKALVIIGFIATIVFIVLLVVIISLMSESKAKTEPDLEEFDDFLHEFKSGNTSKEKVIEINYPELPKIKDLNGNLLLNLLQIELI